jgi:tetratricopeptide (TPR) repeat protein
MACGSPLASPEAAAATTEIDQPAGRYCTRCGSPLPKLGGQEAAFCGRCGAAVGAPAAGGGRGPIARYALLAAAAVAFLALAVIALLAGQAWHDARELRAHYRAGLAALEAGDPNLAVTELSWVVAQSPDYKDALARLAAAHEAADLAALYAEAQAACQEGQWQQAIDILESLRAEAPAYEAGGVDGLLFTAYAEAGLDLAAEGALDEAMAHLGRALAIRPDAAVEKQRELAGLTLEGLACLERSDPFAARDALLAAVAQDPTYAQAAAGLYRARVQCCDALTAEGRLDEAEAECLAALRLQPAGQEAAGGLERIAFLRTPSPTPTPTPTATWTPSPTPEASPTPAATATSAATARPRAPSCRQAARGLIGFKRQARCNARTGDGCGAVTIWVMNADGTGQAPMCNPQAYTDGLLRDRTSPDGTWRVEVRGTRADIARIYQDGRHEMIIVNNRKDWDPVLSLDGWWLAWVTNRNANDEIYIKTLDPQDQNQRRLTVNAWEWDKHPTWSPDGRRIAFYSNRANRLNEATRQIWVMEVVNDQGTNLRNLSNRPDMVDIDPVWFKW